MVLIQFVKTSDSVVFSNLSWMSWTCIPPQLFPHYTLKVGWITFICMQNLTRWSCLKKLGLFNNDCKPPAKKSVYRLGKSCALWDIKLKRTLRIVVLKDFPESLSVQLTAVCTKKKHDRWAITYKLQQYGLLEGLDLLVSYLTIWNFAVQMWPCMIIKLVFK